MAKKPYDEASVLRILSKKRGVSVNGKTINIDSNSSDLGNSSWGKIDYLRKVHSYRVTHDKPSKKLKVVGIPKIKLSKEDDNKGTNKRVKPKLNMAKLSKQAMYRASTK